MATKLEEMLKDSLQNARLRSKALTEMGVSVNNRVAVPGVGFRQIASIDFMSTGPNDGEARIHYFLPKDGEVTQEGRIKFLRETFSVLRIRFTVNYYAEARPEIVKLDYSKYKGESGRAD